MPDDELTEEAEASETTEEEGKVEATAEAAAPDAEETANPATEDEAISEEKASSMESEVNDFLDTDEGDDLAAEMLTALEDETSEDETGVKQAAFSQLKSNDDSMQEENIERLLDVTLNVSVELGRKTMPIKDILSLGPGHIIELDKLAGEPVDLLVNGKKMAKGEVVVVDENFGVRITDLISPEERLKNL